MHRLARSAWTSVLVAACWCRPAAAQVTQRVNVATDGTQSNSYAGFWGAAMSADGRYVVYASHATNLVPGDTNACSDVFVRDRRTNTTERVSVGPGGVQGDRASAGQSISGDGRYVAFASQATNLVAGDTNGSWDVFVRDRQTGTAIRASIDSSGNQGNGDSTEVSLSRDGRFLAFGSDASNLVPGDVNQDGDVFVRDLVSNLTTQASVSSAGVGGDWWSFQPAISSDGRYVAFVSLAMNLVPPDFLTFDVYVRDRQAGTTERVSLSSAGVAGNSDSIGSVVSISADGRYVAFSSMATNLVPVDANGFGFDAYLRDRVAGTTEMVSLGPGGVQAAGESVLGAVSDDGRYVAFGSDAANLVAGDLNALPDVFVRDRQAVTTHLVSVDSAGAQTVGGTCESIAMTPDGRFVSFSSRATNLVPGDTNGLQDEFVHDRWASGFTSLCDPGVDGVIPCPCSNPPGGPGRGCDNSSATGGAILTASGVAYLATDSLVFTTSGQRPSGLSILGQWKDPSATGLVFGMGVRCASGTFAALFARSAVGGGITLPDFSAGDATVSARSAAKGDPIRPGQSRWYVVYYRDPIVLGGCLPTRTINATQTGRVAWWP